MVRLPEQKMTIEFSPETRRQIDRLTRAIEKLAKANNSSVPKLEPVVIYRDAGTGEMVTKEYAEANPDTTVKETR